MQNAMRRAANALLTSFDRSIGWLVKNSSGYVIGGALATCVLVVLAFWLEIASVEFSGAIEGLSDKVQGYLNEKQVGYVWAVNWTIAPFTLMVAGFYFLEAIKSFPVTIDELLHRNMIQRKNGLHARQRYIYLKMRKNKRIASFFSLTFIVFVAISVVKDYFDAVLIPIMKGFSAKNVPKLNDPKIDFDWSISCLFRSSEASCVEVGVFAALAYLVIPGVMLTVALGSYMYLMVLCFKSIFDIGQGGHHKLVPQSDSADNRKGFEALEPLFENITIGLAFSLVSLYLMSFQNIYLRIPEFADILIFGQHLISNSIAAIEADSTIKGFKIFFGKLGGGKDSVQSVYALMFTACLLLISTMLFYSALRALAKKSKRLRVLNLNEEIANLDPKEDVSEIALKNAEIAALENMNYWPMEWGSLAALSLAGIILCISTFFPSIFALMMIALFMIIINWIKKKFLS